MLKLSDGKGFWYNLRLSDKKVYKEAIKVERLMKKIKYCECLISFCLTLQKMVYFGKLFAGRMSIKNHSIQNLRFGLDESRRIAVENTFF